MYSTKDNLELI